MLYFIPSWYNQDDWCESEQYWYARREHSEFDDTVKHVQLFHRRQAYPFRIMLLSYAPNFRHFLHRQGVFHAPYWSCFDAIQEIRKKKVNNFSYHNLKWPSKIEFIYSPFALIAHLKGRKFAQVEFGEDGNLIQIAMFKKETIARRNIYDDRGFVSSTIIYEKGVPVYQDYLNDNGIWKLRQYKEDGHVKVNPRNNKFLLEYEGKEYIQEFGRESYESIEQVIEEVVHEYIKLTKEDDLFCAAMHKRHSNVLKSVLKGKKTILSFFADRYKIEENPDDWWMLEKADYVITDSEENLEKIREQVDTVTDNITDITPFDSRVDLGISQQLNVQKILVPIDGLGPKRFRQVVIEMAEYMEKNPNARVHLFTRKAVFSRKKQVLEETRHILNEAGMEYRWAEEDNNGNARENDLDSLDAVPIRFFVDQCVDELAVSKCLREQRVILDMRLYTEVYLQISGISMGIPQIVYADTQFVKHGKNGMIIKDISQVQEAVAFYLDNLTNWNEAVVHSYELGKKYTTEVLVDKWKEVLEVVRRD